MNIFAVDDNPKISAQSLVDKHVVKMILETAQLLSTAHRILDGEEYIGQSKSGRKAKRWRLPDDRENILYSATHINHPSAVWCRLTNNNYNWLVCHFIGLIDEYTYRYGKNHKCSDKDFVAALYFLPDNIPVGHLTPVTPAMPDEYKVACSVQSYRKYYKNGKAHLHKYTKREMPEWLKD
jgi:hypothetical protein